ncbi:hypothetical protein GOBAR_AA15614 [Gossypium barbadense]|uniref:MADS-box domain-containing protein n=1 Tax=Gossypium barbadense TaxID=3634 RepID=A0A2P5XP21_GOSBA|nr:hypothetical protein GOBAR_AA15614 [Gossypium barbadense]
MGRRKLKIQRLEDMKARQAKYSKRKKGILRKAKELSILCDVEVVLLLSSPSSKRTFFVGQDPNCLYNILQKISNMPFVEREERRAYTMEMLKKFYVNWESEFDPLSPPRNKNVDILKLYEDQVQELKDKLTKKSKILRDWKYPENVKDLNQIKFMEDHLIASLNGLRNRKNQLAMEQQRRQRYLDVGL